jgi:hypothetical protein
VNQALSTVKIAIRNNMDVMVQHGIGKGHVSMIMDEIKEIGAASILLDGRLVDALDLSIPVLRSGSVISIVPEKLLDAEVIIIANIGAFSEESTSIIDSIIADRVIHGQNLDKLKTVIVLHDSFEKMMAEVEMRDTKRPVILATF